MLYEEDQATLNGLLKILRLLRNDVYRPVLQYILDGWGSPGPGPDSIATITTDQAKNLFEANVIDVNALRALRYLERYEVLESVYSEPTHTYRMRLSRAMLQGLLGTGYGILEAFENPEQLYILLEVAKPDAMPEDDAMAAPVLIAKLEETSGGLARAIAKLRANGYVEVNEAGVVTFAPERLAEVAAFAQLVAELLQLLEP
ncbi:MAG TPA: hypothetical protein VNG90_03940 [Candidatus Acidoferrum sp.]|nr:hypothetical protein [Candidatus Acidoferrum sp.]